MEPPPKRSRPAGSSTLPVIQEEGGSAAAADGRANAAAAAARPRQQPVDLRGLMEAEAGGEADGGAPGASRLNRTATAAGLDPIRITHGPDRIAQQRPLPTLIWNRSATKVKLEYVPPTQSGNPKSYQVLERTTSMVEASQVRQGRIGNISPSLMQTKRPEKLHTAVLKHLLKPFSWRPTPRMGPPSTNDGFAAFDLKFEHIKKLCATVKDRLRTESPVLNVGGPVKIFGDIHGQYGDLMQYFRQLGTPCDWMPNGDISTYNYLFLGDWVDRGKFSLETVCLLFALKCQYPARIFLVRGNHEDPGINRYMGFYDECVGRLGPRDGLAAYNCFNETFQWLSPAAVVERCILCVHGGIGRIKWLRQLESLTKPCAGVQELMEANDTVKGALLTDVLWSDPDTSQQGIALDGKDGTVRSGGGTPAAAAGEQPQNGHASADAAAALRCDESLDDAPSDGGGAAAGAAQAPEKRLQPGEHSSDEEDENGLIVNSVGIGLSSRGEGICTFDERVVRGFLRRCVARSCY